MTKSAFRVVKVDTSHEPIREAILRMHQECFPGLDPIEPHGDWWIAHDTLKNPVAFAGLWASLTTPGAGYLCRAGVLPAGRGHGLQRRLIRIREREAKKKRWVAMLSDVDPENAPSMNNLFACGYTAFRPTKPWYAEDRVWTYLRKILTEGVA